jgi:hypothetical protein
MKWIGEGVDGESKLTPPLSLWLETGNVEAVLRL